MRLLDGRIYALDDGAVMPMQIEASYGHGKMNAVTRPRRRVRWPPAMPARPPTVLRAASFALVLAMVAVWVTELYGYWIPVLAFLLVILIEFRERLSELYFPQLWAAAAAISLVGWAVQHNGWALVGLVSVSGLVLTRRQR